MEVLLLLHLLLPILLVRVSAIDVFTEALLGLKSEVIDNSNSLNSWAVLPNQNSPCSWSGVSCNKNSTMVISLDLSNMNLHGTLSGKHIKVLKDLVYLNLSQNTLSGGFPVEVFTLVNLTTLDISRNNFSGRFPDGISSIKNLAVFDAFSNSFTGSLPEDVSKLEYLKVLNLAGSYFEGAIPSAFGSFKRLEFLHLAGNLLDGEIPSELGLLQTMTHMEIGYNFYQGHIPWQLGNMSELQYLDIAGANLSGSIPDYFCKFRKLESLFMFRNQITGKLPWCFGEITSLISLDLSDNFISGVIPESLANLTNLRLLSLMYNDMNGSVPEGIADLPLLETLLLWNNYFSGPLPQKLGQSSKLKYIDVSTNSFSGSIPPDICAGGMLIKLILFSNNFTGGLSPSLTNCSSLVRLRLEDNSFSGEISLKFSLLHDLTYVDLSRNKFIDGIPIHISQASKLEYFNVSENPYLGGRVPSNMWSLPKLENFSASSCGISGNLPPFETCKSFIIVELDMNNISGVVPDSVANCKALERMSLANNHLIGEIPVTFLNCSSLVVLNVSFNDVSGEIPSQENFRLMGASAFTGNSRLCGAPLESCTDSMRKENVGAFRSERKGEKKPTWVLLSCAGMALFILISIMAIFYLKRERKDQWKTVAFVGLPALKPGDIAKHFSYSNSIETPSTSVCKVVLPNGVSVSVKKIEWDSKRATRMEEVLNQIGNARHKNLVRLLGICCNKHVAYLIYDYLPNGNLDEKMRKRGDLRLSTWAAKYKVVIGIARGLCYLHHDCYPAIPHGDLKASNVVFDENMETYLAEFGLNALVQMNGDLLPGRISRTGSVSGTDEIDAIVKEELSRDIYSFGEILLDILSNGRWTNLGENMQKRSRELILKEIYNENEVGSTGALKEEIKLVFDVASLCIRGRPSERPSMNDALKLLSGLKPQRHYLF